MISLLNDYLVNAGYRRVTAEVDTRHIIARKFFEKCTFLLEAILRKHKVIEDRNCDTALYVILNSDWSDNEVKLKKYLGWNMKPKTDKLAAIPTNPWKLSVVSSAQPKQIDANVATQSKKKKNRNRGHKK